MKVLKFASRAHEFSYGHRVAGHESKCANLHGHNAKVTFTIEAADLDNIGRVVDFSVIKEKMCEWLEANWDHKFLMWDKDPLIYGNEDGPGLLKDNYESNMLQNIGVVFVPFNPTAENMSLYLLEVVGRNVFKHLPVSLVHVEFFETSKCSVSIGYN